MYKSIFIFITVAAVCIQGLGYSLQLTLKQQNPEDNPSNFIKPIKTLYFKGVPTRNLNYSIYYIVSGGLENKTIGTATLSLTNNSLTNNFPFTYTGFITTLTHGDKNNTLAAIYKCEGFGMVEDVVMSCYNPTQYNPNLGFVLTYEIKNEIED